MCIKQAAQTFEVMSLSSTLHRNFLRLIQTNERNSFLLFYHGSNSCMMLSKRMTANSLEEKPASHASSSTTKIMRLLAPPALPLPFVGAGGDGFAALLLCTPVWTIFFHSQKHDTHAQHITDDSSLPPPQ